MKTLRLFAPLMAYVTVAIGLFGARSAWVAILGYHAGLLAILLSEKPAIPISRLFKSNNVPGSIGYALVGASSGAALYLFWPVFDITETLPADLAGIGLTFSSWPYFIAYSSLVNPWLEEYFWRGYLGSSSRRLILNDIFFSGFHLLILYGKTGTSWMLFALLLLTFAGWSWRQAIHKTEGLLTPALAHMAADFSILMAVYWMYTK